jgi:hypothetical protein
VKRRDVLARFESKYEPVTESGCWLWTASCGQYGYGQFSLKNSPRFSHRVAWELYKGEIPEGMCVLHKCDTPACVNPNHLFLGTRRDNNADMCAKGRFRGYWPSGEKHGNARLSLEQVTAILADKRLQKTIAVSYGMSQSQISNIKRRQHWKSVEQSRGTQ